MTGHGRCPDKHGVATGKPKEFEMVAIATRHIFGLL